MGVSDVCTSATFDTVKVPAPVYSYRLPLKVVDQFGRDSGLEVAANEPERMAEVTVPDGRSVYWTDPSLVEEPNQLHLYGGRVGFVVQWESDSTDATSAALNSTRVIVLGRDNTALWLRLRPTTLVEKSSVTLEAELTVENVDAINGTSGRPTRKLMLLTLSDVKLLLLPASFLDHCHISRSVLLLRVMSRSKMYVLQYTEAVLRSVLRSVL